METTTLDKLPLGQEAIIAKVGGEGSILRRRLLDMGLTPRTRVMVRKRAPLGDPLEISLRGYELTLRAEESAKITVTPEVSEA
ncbi:FeoA family protein [Phascolarctobacterium succinatutens]|uniref:FeoA family protein n=1 Tax=Phascolarctobacterium succinatutens TaxID=626940 RepID=UPI0026766B17|nr:FeoA family protein [Phascolarctobacterium succinatutens]